MDIEVKSAPAASAKRVSLYLHPDDYKALRTAGVVDEVDINTRLRAAIALWRDDPTFRARLDQLATASKRRDTKA